MMQPTHLTFAYPVQQHPRWGESFLFTGKLTTALGEPVGGAIIYLQSLRNYEFTVCSPSNGQGICTPVSAHVVPQWINEIAPRTQEQPLTAQTNRFGSYYLSVKEWNPGIYQYRMRFLGDNSYYGSVSIPETITIRKWHSRLTWTFEGCPGGTGEYQNYTLKGRLFFSDLWPSADDHHLNNVLITIKKVQTWPESVLLSTIKTTTDRNGYFEIQQNDGSGTYMYKAKFDGNEYFYASASDECIVRIF